MKVSPPGSTAVVDVTDAKAARLIADGWTTVGPGAGEAPERPNGEGLPTCPDCGFVAKTAAGLGAHRRSHDS